MLRGSVYLCFVCLLAPTTQPAPKICSQDIIRQVQHFVSKAPDLKWLDCRLYTPTIDDYKQNCPSSTMKCFASELKVLIEEWKTVGVHSFKLNLRIEKLSRRLNQTQSECLQCELLKEETAELFLQGLQSTLEMMNLQHC